MGERNFKFIEIIMGVILGAVLVATGEILIQDLNIQNFRAILLIIGLLIFADMYIGLVRYHQDLEVVYQNLYLFFDIFIGLFFVAFVELIRSSRTNPTNVGISMVLCGIIFILLAIRQIIPYSRIQDLDTKLERLRIHRKRLQIPIIVEMVGVLICICIYQAQKNDAFLSLGLTGWSWIGIITFVLYVLSEHVYKFEYKISLRAS